MNQTIFITGASSGLGKATAKFFAAKGWSVVATMRNPEKETELTQIKNISILPLDITNLAQIKYTVEKAFSMHSIDVVFNNAGYGLSGPLEAYSDEQITRLLNTNLLGTIRVTKEFVPFFVKKRSGLFITTTSLAGLVGLPLNSVYNAAKFALEGFNESLYYELSPFGIQVKTIAPGAIYTDFVGRSLDSAQLPDYEKIGTDFISYFVGDGSQISSAEYIAEIVYQAVMDERNQIRYIAGKDALEQYAIRLKMGSEQYRIHLFDNFWKK